MAVSSGRFPFEHTENCFYFFQINFSGRLKFVKSHTKYHTNQIGERIFFVLFNFHFFLLLNFQKPSEFFLLFLLFSLSGQVFHYIPGNFKEKSISLHIDYVQHKTQIIFSFVFSIEISVSFLVLFSFARWFFEAIHNTMATMIFIWKNFVCGAATCLLCCTAVCDSCWKCAKKRCEPSHSRATKYFCIKCPL